jgi:hypothetical protein
MPLERIGSNGGNGASHEGHEPPCEDLVDLSRRVNGWESRLAVFIANVDNRMGQMLVAAGEAAGNSKNAARDAYAAKVAAEKVAARVYAPVNEVLEKYHDSVPPTDIEEPMTEITRMDIHSPSASLRRLREEQQRAEENAAKAAKVEQELKAAKAKFYVALAGIIVPLGLALAAWLSK